MFKLSIIIYYYYSTILVFIVFIDLVKLNLAITESVRLLITIIKYGIQVYYKDAYVCIIHHKCNFQLISYLLLDVPVTNRIGENFGGPWG